MIKVLVVDDDLIELEIVKQALNSDKFDCKTISNPLNAFATILEFNPEIVILDLNMPEMNGFELCKQIKTDPRTTHIGVVILTAEEVESNNLLRGIHLGVLDYIHKPVTPQELIQALQAQDASMGIKRSFKRLYDVSKEIDEQLSKPQPMLKLIFGQGRSWRSRLIRLFTWSNWSHVAVIDEDNHVIEAAGGIGVRKIPLSAFQTKYPTHEIRFIPGDINKVRKEVGTRYDTGGLFGWLFSSSKLQDPEEWFCSEIVAYASELYDDKDAHKIDPEDLYRVSRHTPW